MADIVGLFEDTAGWDESGAEIVGYDDSSGDEMIGADDVGADDLARLVQAAVSGYDDTGAAIIGAARRFQGRRQARRGPARPARPMPGRRVALEPTQYTKVREFPMGFDSLIQVPAGSTFPITARPQVPFRGNRLIVPSDLAGVFVISDIKVGKNSQLAASGAIPGRTFQENSTGVRLGLDTAQVGTDITLLVMNIGGAPVRFLATLIGTSLELAPLPASPWQGGGIWPASSPDAQRPDRKAGPPVYKVRFLLATFGKGEWSDRERSNVALGHLLHALYEINCDFLRHYNNIPRLYESGVRYAREPLGREDWQDIPTTLGRKMGDCEDLACWLAAERTIRDGIPSRPVFKFRIAPDTGAALYHIQVCRDSDGAIDDPSRVLGM